MKVLVTGAFGNIGLSALEELLKAGHEVTCFDLPSKANLKTARRFKGKIKVVWGDIRKKEGLLKAVEGQEVVVHLAFIIPKISRTGIDCEAKPKLAEEVNVGGTSKLLQAMRAQPIPPKILFISSLHVYGQTSSLPPPRKVSDIPNPVEHYARHKLACEEMVKKSGLTWAIYRLGAALPISLILDPGMFDVPLWNRMEFVHTRDVGLAIARGIASEEIWGKILHIGGGKSCQLYYREIVEGVLNALGIGMLPEEAFINRDFSTDWLDTEESQRILSFQTRTFQDYIQDMLRVIGWRQILVKAFRPLVRSFLLKRSVPYRQAHSPLRGKVALVTGASRGIGRAISLNLAKEGVKLFLVSRWEKELNELREEIERLGGKAECFPCDLTREEERAHLFSEVMARGGIDILINNAGCAAYGFLEEIPWEQAVKVVNLNALAPLHLSHLFLPSLKARKWGRIINIGSIASDIPSQGIALYSATKSFLSSFSTSLYRELRGLKVCVSTLKLKAVDTEFFENAYAQEGTYLPGKFRPLSPDFVALKVRELILRPRRMLYVPRWLRVIPVLEFSFGWLFDRLGPVLLRRQLGGNPRSLR